MIIHHYSSRDTDFRPNRLVYNKRGEKGSGERKGPFDRKGYEATKKEQEKKAPVVGDTGTTYGGPYDPEVQKGVDEKIGEKGDKAERRELARALAATTKPNVRAQWQSLNTKFAELMKLKEDGADNIPPDQKVRALQQVVFRALGLIDENNKPLDPAAVIDGLLGPYTLAALATYAELPSEDYTIPQDALTLRAKADEGAGSVILHGTVGTEANEGKRWDATKKEWVAEAEFIAEGDEDLNQNIYVVGEGYVTPDEVPEQGDRKYDEEKKEWKRYHSKVGWVSEKKYTAILRTAQPEHEAEKTEDDKKMIYDATQEKWVDADDFIVDGTAGTGENEGMIYVGGEGWVSQNEAPKQGDEASSDGTRYYGGVGWVSPERYERLLGAKPKHGTEKTIGGKKMLFDATEGKWVEADKFIAEGTLGTGENADKVYVAGEGYVDKEDIPQHGQKKWSLLGIGPEKFYFKGVGWLSKKEFDELEDAKLMTPEERKRGEGILKGAVRQPDDGSYLVQEEKNGETYNVYYRYREGKWQWASETQRTNKQWQEVGKDLYADHGQEGLEADDLSKRLAKIETEEESSASLAPGTLLNLSMMPWMPGPGIGLVPLGLGILPGLPMFSPLAPEASDTTGTTDTTEENTENAEDDDEETDDDTAPTDVADSTGSIPTF